MIVLINYRKSEIWQNKTDDGVIYRIYDEITKNSFFLYSTRKTVFAKLYLEQKSKDFFIIQDLNKSFYNFTSKKYEKYYQNAHKITGTKEQELIDQYVDHFI